MSGHSAIRSLAMAVYHRWEPSRLFLFMDVLTGYIDEAGTHGSSAYTVISGLVGYAEEWEKFETRWGELITLAQVPYIHGKELRPWKDKGSGVFKDPIRWPKPKRNLLGRIAVTLAREHFL